MSSEHFVGEITQKALILKNNEVLITRDIDDPKFELPGGRLHCNEDPIEGIKREILEETGKSILVKGVYHLGFVTSNSGKERFMVVHNCEFEDPVAEIQLQEDEITEAVFVNKDNWRERDYYPEFPPLLERFFATIS